MVGQCYFSVPVFTPLSLLVVDAVALQVALKLLAQWSMQADLCLAIGERGTRVLCIHARQYVLLPFWFALPSNASGTGHEWLDEPSGLWGWPRFHGCGFQVLGRERPWYDERGDAPVERHGAHGWESIGTRQRGHTGTCARRGARDG